MNKNSQLMGCAMQTKAATGKHDCLKRPTPSLPTCKGSSPCNLSHPSSYKPSLFKELPCPVVQLHFSYRALWGPFACSVQEEQRKLWFKTSLLTNLHFSVSSAICLAWGTWSLYQLLSCTQFT